MTALGDLDLQTPIQAADVENTPAGGIAATDVQAALNELDTEKAAVGAAPTAHVHSGADITSGTVVDARIDAAIARDSELTAAVAAEASARTTADGLLVAKSLYDANTVLAATTDDTPAALTVGASTFVGRKASGNIAAMTATEAKAVLAIAESDVTNLTTDLAAKVPNSLFDANTVLAANTDDTPAALTMGASTILARLAAGNIKAASVAEINTLLGTLAASIIDAKGDTLVGTANDTIVRKAVGVNGAGFIADDAQSDGIQWRGGIARHRDRNVAMGLLSESFPILAASQNGTHNTGSIAGAAVYLYKGEVVTNIILCVNNAASGAAPTLFKLGLWSSAATPVCLAVTADLKSDAMWTTTGFKVAPLTGAYTILADGIYFPTFLIVGSFGGTAIQFNRGNNAFTGNPIGSFPRGTPVIKGGATDMAVSDTGTGSALGPQWWIAVS